MLKITIPEREMWDERKKEFVYTKETNLCLEHSLVSVSKWESIWHKPFLTDSKKTREQDLSYIKCMTTTQNVDPNVYYALTDEQIRQIAEYINDPMTATTVGGQSKDPGVKQIITSELIYYWMISYGIPFECQKWHLNRLMMLINVCGIKNNPQQKMSREETLRKNRELNAMRRKALQKTH